MRYLKLIIVVLIAPVIVVLTMCFFDSASMLDAPSVRALLWGIVAYMILYTFFWEGKSIYYKGQDILTSTFSFFSPLVKVAPYLLPVYTFFVLVGYLVVSLFELDWLHTTFLFMTSLTLTFHLVMTAQTLKEKFGWGLSPDYLFSLVCIYVITILIACGALELMYGANFSFIEFIHQTVIVTQGLYQRLAQQVFVL